MTTTMSTTTVATRPFARLSSPRTAPTLLRLAPLFLAGALLAVLAVRTPASLGPAALQSALNQAAPIAVVGMALAVVIIAGGDDVVAGGIDLSLAATAALASALLSKLLTDAGWSFAGALLVSVAVAGLIGVLNAALVVGTGMTPILATLATSVLVSGLIRVVTTNRRTDVTHPAVVGIRDGRVLGIPLAFALALVVLALLWVLLHRTTFGIHLQAVGGNRDAAALAGLRAGPFVAVAFVIAALVAGLDSVLLTARGSGFSPGMEQQLLVDMVLVGYLSPVFSRRGTVTVLGALLSAVLVAVLSNALILSRVDNSWVYGLKGALILAVVVTSALAERRPR